MRRQAALVFTRWAAAALLGIVFGLAFMGARAAFQTDANAATIRRLCEDSNKQSAKEKQVWEFVIALSANNPSLQTPEQRAEQTRRFVAFLDDIYKPQVCE